MGQAQSGDCARLNALTEFVRGQALQLGLESELPSLKALSGDAGMRRYYRSAGLPGIVAVDAPVQTENSELFVRLCRWFGERGLRVPKLLAADLEQGFLLLEDLGDRLLQHSLDNNTVDGYYAEAMTALLHLQSVDAAEADFLPRYDAALLSRELNLFDQWFVTALLQFELSQAQQQALSGLNSLLIDSALAQPQVVVHRDYHSRNLMLLCDDSLALIDFQDAVLGPLNYDVVSLLKDCYVSWPRAKLETWALSYASLAHEAGLLPACTPQAFLRSLDLMGLQRHLKVLGIFARLSLRDNKHQYLADLPRVLNYVVEALELCGVAPCLISLFDKDLRAALKHRLGQASLDGFGPLLR
ncbi:aminoglycoside phosphotransferase family protein [Agaribacterium haliotis]|uniref:aminoglycoside phosphotransferase family protein n=1 Tax=Agaribacterium haliotis TaxID=2013869 RepID=UPI000BB548D7|nr:phosphotransferase [Agaribacterium haliotis]